MRAKGVDYNSKVKLRKLWSQGYNSTEIAQAISVDQAVVENWMGYFEKNYPKESPEKETPAEAPTEAPKKKAKKKAPAKAPKEE